MSLDTAYLFFWFGEMRWILCFLCSFLLLIAGDQHPNTNGPFGKRHTQDSLHILSGYDGPSNLLFSVTLVDVSTLNLSTTVYSNSEEIKVTWTPFSITCKDDFIGIYSTDIPVDQSKYIILL